ncbi:MogA/MoaB family molybdenum cofactor biosynthesis protein [bacterium]|nr:MogA/MoaB family molybdenum cofactor biosynthesis protein [bacterium]MBU0899305.1 MogA/MoaB family molybdenum cofactor biosynthesis protein [bacterium]MBU1153114.1 MogA/MoaB family molybdenum cofactor biosynthesis protein [bacterium]MBU1782135.1 MogA/MoaB family molybdenum cofactor biosynthesis protein [bacterium]MBU2599223.1 MogA/MoaB family molybdenum cofactor biosynthesis protein [bacterium]
MNKAGILIISDKASKGEREDLCTAVIEELLKKIKIKVLRSEIIPDEEILISNKLMEWTDIDHLNLVVTSGGTGIGPRDVTPEATKKVIEKDIPGLAEAMRLFTFQITPRSIISRALAGMRKKSIIINLPGSPNACRECLEVILNTLPHALEIASGEKMECAREVKDVSK